MTQARTDIQIRDAAARLEGVVTRTPLVPFEVPDERVRLWLKVENQQVTGSFKARGAWNQISLLREDERARGVIATSSPSSDNWTSVNETKAAYRFETSIPSLLKSLRCLDFELIFL